MRLKYCLPQLGLNCSAVCVWRRYFGFCQLQPISRGIRWRRVSFYLDFYLLLLLFLLLIIIIIPVFSRYFFLCINPFKNSYSSSLSPCTADLRLFPSYLLLFHFFITAHIFPSLFSNTFIKFSFSLSSIHCIFPPFFTSSSFRWLYFSFTFIFALLSLPPYPLMSFLILYLLSFPSPFFLVLVLFVSSFLFVLAARPKSRFLSDLSFRQYLFNFCSSVGIVNRPQAGRSGAVAPFLER